MSCRVSFFVVKLASVDIFLHPLCTISQFWIGLNDAAQEGKFVWSSDGAPISYDNWGHQQPDNIRVSDYSMRGQHYVAVHKLLRYWDDSDGNRKLPVLCQV